MLPSGESHTRGSTVTTTKYWDKGGAIGDGGGCAIKAAADASLLIGLGPGKTFVTYMRNFPFFLLHNNTATFAKLSQKFLATQHIPTSQHSSHHIRNFESVFFPSQSADLPAVVVQHQRCLHLE